MKKTSGYINSDVDVSSPRRADAEGQTKAALTRAALREAAAGAIGIKPTAAGVFAGSADLSARVDEHIAASGFGES